MTITGLLSQVNPELARGVFHDMEGWVIFLIALAMIAVLHLTLTRFFKPPQAAHA